MTNDGQGAREDEVKAEASADESASAGGEGQPQPPLDEKARRRQEIESFLGPQVRTPVGIPDGYTPTDRSIHPLFHIELEALAYAGPLDLLLYLIRRHDLDVLDIPIAFLTDRYLEMLEALEALEIDTAAEFLVLASELTHIKSKMLLPAEKGVAVDDPPEEEEQGDPRAELVRRLLEYQKYRDAAAQLADRDQLGRDVFPRIPPVMDKVDDLDPGLKQVNVFRLVELMARLLQRVPAHHEIAYESYSIGERIQFVHAFGETTGGRFTLLSLIEQIASRTELVVTFIALLEMAKMGLVRILVEDFDSTGAASREDTPSASEGIEVEDRARSGGEHPDAYGSGVVHPAERDALPEGSPSSDPDGPEQAPMLTEADATKREAEALEALAAEAASEGGLSDAGVDLTAPVDPPKPAPPEPLPEVWVELTEQQFQGQVEDDYGP